MESMFKKRDRMMAYAYALEQFSARDPKDTEGACYVLIEFLQKEAGYDLNNFFFFNGRYHFPELYKEKTRELECIHDHWFNNNQERIEALKNILKIKE